MGMLYPVGRSIQLPPRSLIIVDFCLQNGLAAEERIWRTLKPWLLGRLACAEPARGKGRDENWGRRRTCLKCETFTFLSADEGDALGLYLTYSLWPERSFGEQREQGVSFILANPGSTFWFAPDHASFGCARPI